MNMYAFICFLIAAFCLGVPLGIMIEYKLFKKFRCKHCHQNNYRISNEKNKKMLRLKDAKDRDFLLFVDKNYSIVGYVNLSSLYYTWKYIKNLNCTSCDKNYNNVIGELYKDINGNTMTSYNCSKHERRNK